MPIVNAIVIRLILAVSSITFNVRALADNIARAWRLRSRTLLDKNPHAKENRIASGEEKPTPTVPISPDRSLDQGFANNGVVARGPFFRWRLDTHRIYILLLLLGKRSSAERLFNTTRSFARPPGYFTIVGPRVSRGREPPALPRRAPIKASSFKLSPRARLGDKNWSTTLAARVGGWNCK